MGEVRAAWAHLLALALAACASAAHAHHSLTGYDQSRQVTLEGRVAEFAFTQPHPILTIEVEAAGGKQAWRLEMDNLSELRAVGLSSEAFKPRDRVLVSGNPSRDGSRSLYLRLLDRPQDGLRYEQPGSSPKVSIRPRP
jgi:hypothetical protein